MLFYGVTSVPVVAIITYFRHPMTWPIKRHVNLGAWDIKEVT